jgi:hypothetical protein
MDLITVLFGALSVFFFVVAMSYRYVGNAAKRVFENTHNKLKEEKDKLLERLEPLSRELTDQRKELKATIAENASYRKQNKDLINERYAAERRYGQLLLRLKGLCVAEVEEKEDLPAEGGGDPNIYRQKYGGRTHIAFDPSGASNRRQKSDFGELKTD